MNLVLDYIYQGEVQIYQEKLDRFLEIAKNLKLDGLMATDDNQEDHIPKDEPNLNLDSYVENPVDFPMTEKPKTPIKKALKVVKTTWCEGCARNYFVVLCMVLLLPREAVGAVGRI